MVAGASYGGGGLVNYFNIELNALQGSIPEALDRWLAVLVLGHNFLAGAIPVSIALLPQLRAMDLGSNSLTGNIPPGFIRRSLDTSLEQNRLTGLIPELAVGPDLCINTLVLGRNALAGSIPDTLFAARAIQRLDLRHNRLGGSLPELTRTNGGDWFVCRYLVLGGNYFEGTVPSSWHHMTQSTLILDISGALRSRVSHLTGTLPHTFGRLCDKPHGFMLRADSQALVGSIPKFRCTFTVAALQNNLFEALPELHVAGTAADMLRRYSVVILNRNRLSCDVPTFENKRISGWIASGNYLFYPRQFPQWIVPAENAAFLWASREELFSLSLQTLAGAVMLLWMLFRKLSRCELAMSLYYLRCAGGCVMELAAGLRASLRCMWLHVAWTCFLVLVMLCSKNAYLCPSSYSRFCAPLSTGSVTRLGMVMLWIRVDHVAFSHIWTQSPAVPRRSYHGECRKRLSRLLWWACWLVTVTLLSLPAIVRLVGRSVPQPLGVSKSMLAITSVIASVSSGLNTGVVIPELAKVASCVVPASVVVLLHDSCLAWWLKLWYPCLPGQQHGSTLVHVRVWVMTDLNLGRTAQIVLDNREVCSPQARRSTLSMCTKAFLRQWEDVLLGKLVASGLAVPAARLMADLCVKTSGEVVAQVASLIGLATLFSPTLPLASGLILIGMLSSCIEVVIAIRSARLTFRQDVGVARLGLLITLSCSRVMHALLLVGA